MLGSGKPYFLHEGAIGGPGKPLEPRLRPSGQAAEPTRMRRRQDVVRARGVVSQPDQHGSIPVRPRGISILQLSPTGTSRTTSARTLPRSVGDRLGVDRADV